MKKPLRGVSLIWLACLLALASGELPAAIYKQVLPDGTVSYSNEPRPGAEKIEPPLPQVIPAMKPAAEPSPEQPAASAAPYATLRIAIPADDQVIWSSERTLGVSVEIVPPLRIPQGHRLVILLDGTPVSGPGTETQATLSNVDRGTHTLMAEVRDALGRGVMQSATVTFHLKQHSSLPPARPAAP